jgi:hypothetical protein
MRLRVLIVLALAVAAVAAFASPGQSASTGSWYWSPGLCYHFVVFARANNGVVRGFDLYPTNRNGYRAEGIELAPSLRWPAGPFVRHFGPIAAGLARIELEKGCAPYGG